MQTAKMTNDDDEVLLVAAGIGDDFVGPKGLGPPTFGTRGSCIAAYGPPQ